MAETSVNTSVTVSRPSVDRLKETWQKYVEKEEELERKMRESEERYKKVSTGKYELGNLASLRLQREKSRARNQQLLKDLTQAKAILRTKSAFSPTELELRDLAAAYRKFLQE